jgi:hypothetical protein
MTMQIIRERAISIKPDGKNYLVRGWQLMVTKAKKGIEKAEENKTRTQFWATTVMIASIPVVVALCSWFSVHLINYGAQQARQEMFDKETKRLEQVIAEKEKEIRTLLQKRQAEDVKSDPPAKPKQQPRNTRGRRQRLSGAVELHTDSNTKQTDIKDVSKGGK